MVHDHYTDCPYCGGTGEGDDGGACWRCEWSGETCDICGDPSDDCECDEADVAEYEASLDRRDDDEG